ILFKFLDKPCFFGNMIGKKKSIMILVHNLEAFNHGNKIVKLIFCSRINFKINLIDILHYLKNRALVMVSHNSKLLYSAVSYSSCRIINNPYKSFFIFRVNYKP